MSETGGHKVFVSYKYGDINVAPLEGFDKHTPRDYVSYLQEKHYSGDDLNVAEKDDEDLSEFKEDYIRESLKDKIWGSSITIILISPNMVDELKNEQDQWIPWEVAYSLRTQTRNGKRSQSNAVLAVILPDLFGSYDYFINEWSYEDENTGKSKSATMISTDKTFQIIRDNMFNQINPTTYEVLGRTIYIGASSYIKSVKWKDFIKDIQGYQDYALDLRDHIDEYDIHKSV